MPQPEEYRNWLYNLYIKGSFKGSVKNKMMGGSRGGMKSIAEVEKNIVMKKCSHPDPKSKNKMTQVLFFTFLFQLVPLIMAKKKRQKDCHFVMAKKLRRASDQMIY